MKPELKPKFSIITVAYNASKTIERTLKSVECQSYPNIEYLIIDGASTDNTLTLVQTISPQAIILSEPDKGIYDAMNKGLELATGDYICFMNAGDCFKEDNCLEVLVETINYTQDKLPDLIYGDTELIDSTGKAIGLRRLRPPKNLSWQTFKKGMLVCHQSFLPKRSLCPRYNLCYRFSADFDWCIRIMKKSQSFFFSNQIISQYLNEGTTSKNRIKSLCERFSIMSKHYGLIQTIYQHISFIFIHQR